jgi:hypothetical protein
MLPVTGSLFAPEHGLLPACGLHPKQGDGVGLFESMKAFP